MDIHGISAPWHILYPQDDETKAKAQNSATVELSATVGVFTRVVLAHLQPTPCQQSTVYNRCLLSTIDTRSTFSHVPRGTFHTSTHPTALPTHLIQEGPPPYTQIQTRVPSRGWKELFPYGGQPQSSDVNPDGFPPRVPRGTFQPGLYVSRPTVRWDTQVRHRRTAYRGLCWPLGQPLRYSP